MIEKKVTRRRAQPGRPTAAQAEKRHRELLDEAMNLFLVKGYELTTLDAIAEVMHMTKRTIYGLYPNKEELFKAALNHAIESNLVPLSELEEMATGDLESALVTLATAMVDNYISPRGLRLHRVVNAEAYRFPGLIQLIYEKDTKPVIQFLTNLFARHTQIEQLQIDRPEATGALFFAIAVGAPARAFLSGGPLADAENLDDYIHHCVRLFLNGIKRR